MIDRAVEHLGAERAGRYLRKFYPWYLERLGRRNAPIRRRSQRRLDDRRARALMAAAASPLRDRA